MLWKISIPFLVMALTLDPAAAFAQAEDPVPLKNWPAPLYWQPTAGEAAENSGVHERMLGERAAPALAAMASFPTAPLVYVAVTPCRLVDTRTPGMPAGYGPPSMAGGSTRTIATPAGGCGLPAAQAYSVTVTVVPPGGAMMRWLTLYPTGTVLPSVATLNDKTGLIINNAAVVPTGTPLGSFNIYVTDTTDVIIDVNGYYVPPATLALGAGAVSTPSLTLGPDTTTGLYSIAPGSLSIATAGAERVRVNGNMLSVAGSLDFSDSILLSGTSLLRADADDVFLGVGANGSLASTFNTAVGDHTLASVIGGSGNTAIGHQAGMNIVNAGENVAVGSNALAGNASSQNTAVGAAALAFATGDTNTAVGARAGLALTSGSSNTLLGYNAGNNPVTGSNNVALGDYSGYYLSSGEHNTFVGSNSGSSVNTGGYNTLVGDSAGAFIQDGHHNIVLGASAGANLTSGTYNIDIGASPAGDESATIRIGDANQVRTFLSGIRGAVVAGGQTVLVDANGQLGSVSSSRRFKQDIEGLSGINGILMALRPVSFRYKAQGAEAPRQFGLIAEEVFEVSPELVGRDKDGQIDSVAYDKVYVLMLKELQEQRRVIESQNQQLDAQRRQMQNLESRLAEVEGHCE